MKATPQLEPAAPDTATPARPAPQTRTAQIAQSESYGYNPYLAGRLEWDEQYGDVLSRERRSNRIALICSGITLVLACAVAVMVLRPSKIVVVGVNSATGQYLGSGISGQPVAVTEEMKHSALSDWVTNVRLVTPDGISQRTAIEKVYSMISGGSSAQTFVSDFYRSNPPQTRAQSQTVHVQINSVLPTSGQTYLVEWTEVTRDLQGKVLFQQRHKGAFSIVVSASSPNDERLARLNPIGLYITQASWSEVL